MSAANEATVLLEGGLVLTAAAAPAAQRDVLIERGRIKALLPPGTADRTVVRTMDATGKLVVPGLVNAHTHSHFTFGKGLNPDWTLEVHQHVTAGITGGLSPEEHALMAQVAAAEMVAKGCTAAYDMVVQLPVPTVEGIRAVARGYAAVGLRARIALTLSDRSLWHAVGGLRDALPPQAQDLVDRIRFASVDEMLGACREVVETLRGTVDNIEFALAPTIPLFCSPPLLSGVASLARELGVPIHTHLSESKLQAIASRDRFGKPLVAHLRDIGFLGPDVTVAHAIWLDADEIRMLADAGVSVAHNPVSNARLGNGVAAVRELLDLGLTVGIGTDACTCSDQLNMFEATRHASLVSRLAHPEPERWLGAQDVFRMATQGSAKALGFDDLGTIEAGARADLLLIDLSHVNYVPLNDPLTQVVFNENGAAVKGVMIGGDLVYSDGRFSRFDHASLARRANEVNHAIRERLAPRRRELEGFQRVVSAYLGQANRRPYPVGRYGDGA